MFDEDISLNPPDYNIPIDWVGISNIYLPAFYLKIGGSKIFTSARVNAYIDLPSNYKGIHASRNYESIVDVFKKYMNKDIDVIRFCNEVSKELLDRYPYSKKSYVSIRALIIYPDKTPLNRDSFERAYILCRSYAKKIGEEVDINRYIGIETTGLTACPSAQRNILNTFIKDIQKRFNDDTVKKILGIIPYATHTQRIYVKIAIQVPDNISIDILKLIKIARESMSSPTFEFLKRDDETKLILNSLKNPKFVEDVIREISAKIAKEFGELPNSCKIKIYVKSLESIHQHNLIGYLRSNLGSIRSYILK